MEGAWLKRGVGAVVSSMNPVIIPTVSPEIQGTQIP